MMSEQKDSEILLVEVDMAPRTKAERALLKWAQLHGVAREDMAWLLWLMRQAVHDAQTQG